MSVPHIVLGSLARVALLAALLLPLAGPPQALAASSGPTMVISLKAFPDGTQVPNTLTGSVPLNAGEPVSLTAPLQVYGPGSPQAAYVFGFWNITTDVESTQTVTFTPPHGPLTIYATAWYLPQGPGCPTCPQSLGRVTTYAFSLNNDQVIANTPIGSVMPGSAWAGPPSTSVSTTTSTSSVAITAKAVIGGYGSFHQWLRFGDGTINNSILTVAAGKSSMAIAFYGIPIPDPCEGIRTALDNLSPGDFSSPQAYQNASKQLAQQLRACEQQYGEN